MPDFTLLNDLLGDFQTATDSYVERTITSSNQLFADFIAKQKVVHTINKKQSSDFNVFRLFQINEPRHSFILASFLDPKGEHGQGNLFLKALLIQLGIEEPGEGNWTVTAEAGRVDILLKRTSPINLHSVIIIENKSNNAPDQKNQLYRYWYHEIYKPQQHLNPKGQLPYAREQYQIIYLVANEWKKVSDNSLQRPNEELYNELPEVVPLSPVTWKFQEQISEVFTSCLDALKDNQRLRESIIQYIDYWR